MRAEALSAALSAWANPSELDRVDGRYRGKIKRDAKAGYPTTVKPVIAWPFKRKKC